MKIPIMKRSLAEYELYPRAVAVNEEFTFRARGLGIETALTPGKKYIIRFIPQEEIATARTLEIGDEGCYEELSVVADKDGILNFSHDFSHEEIYTLRLLTAESDGIKKLCDFRVFATGRDLWERIPMRGNLHCHACHSVDGSEDPVIAASVYRKAGFDFLAITDHHKIDGSVFAIEHLKDIPNEMTLFYGEEVHVPNAYIHAINIGARMPGGIGLDKWYHEHEDEVNAEVKATADSEAESLPNGIEPYDWAWRKWIADTIHRNGGIAIIAHPFWEYDAHNTSDAMFGYLIKTKLFDAAEIVFGQDDPDSSEINMQLGFWNDIRAEGHYITPVGVDDAHRRSFPWNCSSAFNAAYTILFARDKSFNAFTEAIKGGFSAAVECYGNAPEHVTATYRLTKYTIFLSDQYFPYHDELCFEEGCRIKDAYLGDNKSLEILRVINGRVKEYTDKFFGR